MTSPALLLTAAACAMLAAGCTIFRPNPLDSTPTRSKILVGPTVGLNRNFHTGGFRTINDPLCGLFESGQGEGYLVGLTGEALLNRSGSSSLISRIAFEKRPGSFTQNLPDALVLLPNTTTPISQSVDINSDITYDLLSFELMYRQEIGSLGGARIGLSAGPVISAVVGSHNKQFENLITPENARFINPNPSNVRSENNGRTLVLLDEAIPGQSTWRASMKAGIQLEYGLFGNKWMMTPGLYYDFGITDVTRSENWQLNSLLFTIDFRHAF